MGTSESETTSNNNLEDEPLYPELSADNETGLTEIESLCMNCEEEGMTKLLFIKIPFYKEIILSSFSCPHCFYSNNEIQSAGAIQDKGITLLLTLKTQEDLNRQVVRADSATVSIPALQFEIPPHSQKGTLSTVEGIIQRAIDGLNQQQPLRMALEPEVAEKIGNFIEKLRDLLLMKEPFVFKIDDPSGNSFIENPSAPSVDPNLIQRYYLRTIDQDKLLGLQVPEVEDSFKTEDASTQLDLANEVLTFLTNCSNCNSPCETNMKMVKIPYFKEVIIMATTCDKCGHRTNEVKSGSGFEPKGKRLTLNAAQAEDLSRDVLKSETCRVIIPELELESGGISISGKFTTVEGLILDIKNLMVDGNPFVGGDSTNSDKLVKLGEELQELADGKRPFTLILDDPNSNSYVQDLYLPEVDPRLKVEEYERTDEQNEELGISGMKTENYS